MATKTECDRCGVTTSLVDGWKTLRVSTLRKPQGVADLEREFSTLRKPQGVADLERELCPSCAEQVMRTANEAPDKLAKART